MSNVFIPYSGVYSQSHSRKSTSCPQQECISQLPPLHNSGHKRMQQIVKGLHLCPCRSCLEFTLHKIYWSQVCREWLHGQNRDKRADEGQLHANRHPLNIQHRGTNSYIFISKGTSVQTVYNWWHFVQPFSNMVRHSRALLFSNALFRYCAECQWLISVSSTPWPTKILTLQAALLWCKWKV